MSSDFSEKKLTSRTVYRGKLLHVKEDEVELPDGRHAVREYIMHSGAVVIIPFLGRDTLLLEHQFRYPVGRHFYELPAGKVEAGEDTLFTAQRELLEETGYEAGEWRHLTTLYPCVGYADERIELYHARELRHVGHPGENGEFIEALEVELDTALEWVRDGRISEAKTIMGVLWAEKIVREGW
ncbi:MAG: NUDIX hydrolase [Pseudomonadota bacterium]